MIKYYLVSFMLFASQLIFSQANIRGKVIDEQQNPIVGATVFVEDGKYYDISDENGSYKLFNIPAGSYMLAVSFIGYEAKQMPISIKKDQNLHEDIILSEGLLLKEVVINSRIEGQAKALNTQKNKKNIATIISSEQIERFPDANIGDALKRMSGINVQYDQGEARFANIRGTAPELNSVTINGERIPSAEAEKRYVQLDLVPADIIGSVEVNKAVMPDMDADAIGGSINLITKKAPAKQIIEGTIGSGYSILAKKPVYKGKLSYSNRFNNNKVGLLINASILDKSVRSDNIEPEWDYTDENNKDGSAYTNEMQIRQYYLERLRRSFAATLDFDLDKNNNIFLTGMYNWRNDWENRYRLQIKDIEEDAGQLQGEIRRQTKGGSKDNKNARLEDQQMISLSVGGKHFFNKIKVDWGISTMKASEDRPNERYVTLRKKDVPISLDTSDLTKPSVTILDASVADLSEKFGLKELTEEFKYTDERDINAGVNLEIPIFFGDNASTIKLGSRFKIKSKERNNTFKDYEPINEDGFVLNALNNTENQTNENYNAGDYQIGTFVSNKFLGNLNFNSADFEGEINLEELAGNFNAKEEVYAGYAMYTQNIGEKWTIVGGLRFEQTKLNYAGKIFDGENLTDSNGESDSYSNILPGLHIKYSPTKWTNIRVAWTNTLARPNYYDLVPYQQINTDDNYITIGNPSLEATASMNIDVLGEHFFKNVGVLSAGFFYKDLTNVIADITLNDYNFNATIYDRFTQAVNAGNGTIYGFEAGVQRRLDFLPGALANLSLYANYTYTKSELKDITLEDREDEVLPLAGTPQNLFNTSLAFDTKKFDIRVSYNFASAFIEKYNDETFFDRWYDQVMYLDINANYRINKNWKIYASANNLLNQPLRYYQGVVDRTMQAEFYGIHTKLGVKFKF